MKFVSQQQNVLWVYHRNVDIKLIGDRTDTGQHKKTGISGIQRVGGI
jgi:hypothetical protein